MTAGGSRQAPQRRFTATVKKGQTVNNEATLNALEARAREIAGAIHSHGAIPAKCWHQAIAERFLNEPVRDLSWAERMIARWSR